MHVCMFVYVMCIYLPMESTFIYLGSAKPAQASTEFKDTESSRWCKSF